MSKGSKLKSCTQYFCAALVALVAVLVAIIMNLSTKPDNVVIDLSQQRKTFSPAQLSLSEEQIANYHRDGVLLVRGLLTPEEATTVADAAEEMIPKAPYSIFDFVATSNYAKIMFDLWRTDETIARLSLQSLPSVASQMIDDTDGKIRLLRDAYFSYETGGKGCGWHVDDEGFWPAQNDTSGITIWIALDKMKVSEGGGLAVANRTHVRNEGAEWVQTCLNAIKGKTCNMETENPECWEKMEQIKLQWDMNPGDAILWDRWSFHRTVVASTKDDDQKKKQRRYSVRYMPSSAKAIGAVHHSVEQGSYFESPYYPQVWPNLIDSEVKALEHGLEGDVTPANIAKTLGVVLVNKFRGIFK